MVAGSQGRSITHFSSQKPESEHEVGPSSKGSPLFHYLPKLWLREPSRRRGCGSSYSASKQMTLDGVPCRVFIFIDFLELKL